MQLKGVQTDQGGTVAEWPYSPVGGQLTLTTADMPQVRDGAAGAGAALELGQLRRGERGQLGPGPQPPAPRALPGTRRTPPRGPSWRA